MIKTVSQAIDDMAVSLGADPSAEIPTVAQALENVYTALGGTRTDLDTLVVSEVIDLVAPLIQGGGGGGDLSRFFATLATSEAINRDVTPTVISHEVYKAVITNWITVTTMPNTNPLFFDEFTISVEDKTLTFPMVSINDTISSDNVDGWVAKLIVEWGEGPGAGFVINLEVITPSGWTGDVTITADAIPLLMPSEEFDAVMNA